MTIRIAALVAALGLAAATPAWAAHGSTWLVAILALKTPPTDAQTQTCRKAGSAFVKQSDGTWVCPQPQQSQPKLESQLQQSPLPQTQSQPSPLPKGQ